MKKISTLILLFTVSIGMAYSQCTGITAPFTENFDALPNTSPWTALPTCWEVQTGPDFWDLTNDVFNNGHTYLPNIGDHTTGSTAGNYMWMDASGSAGAYVAVNGMVTPNIDFSGLTTPYVGFWYASNNTGATAPNTHSIALDAWDGLAWVTLTTVSGNFPGWVEVAAVVPGTIPTTTKFRIRGINNDAATFYNDLGVDDFFLVEAPSCPSPINLGTVSVTANSAVIEWTEGGSATQWEVEYGAVPYTPTGVATVTGLIDTFATLMVSPVQDYVFWVRAICGPGDTSAWTGPSTFTTPCAPITPPYLQDFSTWTSTTTLPNCWNEYDQQTPATVGSASPNTVSQWLNDGFGNNAASPYSVTATVGSASIELWNLSDQDWLVTPEFDLSTGGPYQMDFNWVISNWSSTASEQIGGDDYVAVLITIDGGTTWTELGRYDASTNFPATLLGNEAIYDLTAYAGSVVQFGFFGDEGTIDDPGDVKFFLDNFQVRAIPSCPKPQNLAVSGVTDIDADVSWTEFASATMWEVQYGAPGFAFGAGTSVIVSGTPTTTISGLTQLTDYEVYVRAICAPGDSSLWTNAASFRTEIQALACAPGTGNPFFVYEESFEFSPGCTSATTTTNLNGYAGLTNTSGTVGTYWRLDCGSATSSGWIDAGAYDGSAYLYLETSSITTNNSDTVTTIDYDISTLVSSARFSAYYLNGGSATLEVERSLDAGATWTNIFVNTGLGGGSAPDLGEWTIMADDISAFLGTATTVRYRFIGYPATANSGDIGLDLFRLETCVSCLPPSAISATVISADSALVEFTPYAGAGNAVIEYGIEPFTQGTGTVVTTTLDSIFLTGLTPASNYSVYVGSDCSGSTGDSSILDGPYSFTTPCAPITPTYTEDFSNWTSTTTLPLCWEEYDQVDPATIGAATPNTNGQWLNDGFANNAASPFSVTATVGSASIELWNQTDNDWLVSPEMNLTTGGPYQLDYNWIISQWSTYAAGQILGDDFVAVLVTDDNGATWTELGRYDSTTIVPLSLTGQTAVFDLTAFSGSVIRIGFWGSEGTVDDPSDIKFFLDNFRVRPIPTCPEPLNMLAANVTDNTVDLSWTEFGSATNWIVEYGAPGFTPGTGTSVAVSGTPATTVSGLTEQSDYEFTVRAFCSVGDTSSYSSVAAITTLCAPLAAPALETFELVSVGAFGDLGNCWTTTPTTGYRWESENSTGANENSLNTGPFTDHTLAPASGGIYMYTEASSGSLGDETFLNSPLVDLSGLSAPNITFWYHMYGVNMGSLELEINDGSGWTTIASVVGQQQTAGGDLWTKVSTNITTYTGIVSFRFKGIRGSGFESDMSVDDVSIQEAPANEIGVTAISSPVSGCGSASTDVTLTVDNFGVNTLYYVPVVVEVSGDYTGVYTLVIDTLPALSTSAVTLASLNTLAGGTMTINAFTNLANDEDPLNDTTLATLNFGAVPSAPVMTDVAVCNGEDVSLTPATSNGITSWYASDTSSSPFFEGDTLMLTALNDTTFYVGQQETFAGTFTLDMFDSLGDGWNGGSLGIEVNGSGVLNSPFALLNGSAGQEFFTAAHGDSITITYFTGSFDTEVSYTISDPNGNVIFQDGFASPVTLGQVFNGEIYSAGCPSELAMVSVTINPSYMDTVVMTACDSMMIAGMNETASGFYTEALSTALGCDSVVVYDLTINNSTTESLSASICTGAMYTLPDGMMVSTSGLYTTVLVNAAGCDSVVKTDLNVVSSYSISQNVQICSTDSVVVGTSVYTATGTYTDLLVSSGGCDSTVTTNLVVYPAVDVTLGGVSTVCENAAVIDLTLDPVGGTLSGPGVTGTSFDAAAAGLGSHVLVYAFTGPNGCAATASLNVDVVVCTGIDNIEGIQTISIYPNPFVSTLNVMFDDAIAGELNIKLFDVTGRVLMTQNVNTTVGVNNIALNVPTDIAAGVTLIQIERNGAIYSTSLIKK